jgi:anion-transporting  ArsA/GET3 family ATPase
MRDTLGDPATSAMVMVTLPEELPVMETAEALDDLAREPVIDLAALVVNRVLAPLGVDPSVVDRLPAGPQREAAMLQENLFADQQPWLDMLPPGPRLPYLFGFLTPGEVAARLVDHWDRAS